MNKWVVFLLMALAFLAGAMSFKNGANTSTPVASASPQSQPTPQISATADVTASATPLASVSPEARTSREPSFGVPPKRGDKKSSSPKSLPPGTNISAYVFSTTLDGPSQTVFPVDTDSVYMTVTPIGLPRGVELVASYRTSLKEDAPFSEPVKSSGPQRKQNFRLTPPESGWASGPYQVVIKPVNSEQVLTIARFEIAKEGASADPTYPTPEYIDLVRSPQDKEARSVFDQTDGQVGLLIDTGQVPESVTVRAIWSAVEVDQLASGEIIAVTEKQAPGKNRDAYFILNPSASGFLPGSYRVDVYYNQQEMGSQAFFIQPAAKESASSSPTP